MSNIEAISRDKTTTPETENVDAYMLHILVVMSLSRFTAVSCH